ncbi:hypothetical protein GCM10025861_02460 [Methanobacterium petrolearium]|nr:hypothetical protein GCM10025861_02460 [Methanobacterium petrolearium]
MEKGLLEILSAYPGTKSDIIPILQDIQANFGYLPEEMMKDVSNFTRVPESEIYGVATFYSQFRFTPGEKIIFLSALAQHAMLKVQIIL